MRLAPVGLDVKGGTCAIATPHTSATDVAARSVRAGGNAIDAAIAAAFALTVVYPHNTSLGGDLFALITGPNGEITSINASGYAGRHVDADHLATRYGSAMPSAGIDTVTVPGAVGGLAALHRLGAALPWGANLTAAIEMAENGVEVPVSLASAIGGNLSRVWEDPGLRSILAPRDRPLDSGEELRQPALALSLRDLAESGPASFYQGELAGRLVEGLQSLGSQLDLAEFLPQVGAPLRGTFHEFEVWTSGPNSQGFLLLEILGMLEELDRSAEALGEDAWILSEIFQLAASDRHQWLSDPTTMAPSVADLLAPDRLRHLVSTIHPTPSPPRTVGGPLATRGSGDTVAVVAADDGGRAVSLIQSVFHPLGAAVLEPETGILLHNRGSSFSLSRRSPNRIAPRKRPAHTLMPWMVTLGGRPTWIVGTMGGTRQPQIGAQLLLQLTSGKDPEEALAAPRWVVEGGRDDPVAYVEESLASVAISGIEARFPISWQGSADELTGRAQIARIADDGTVSAASDPRGEGSSQLVEMTPSP
jgi:gamma-glutamyltranspeptidase